MSHTKPPQRADEIEKAKDEESKDVFGILYIVFFLMGIVYMLPSTFFITAHHYWMHKFRNTTLETMDAKDRIKLQSLFSPGLATCRHSASVIFLFLGLLFERRFTINFKLFGSLGIMLGSFIFAAIFIQIDTDDWQVGFFVLMMVIMIVITAMNSIFGMAVKSILTYFPREYSKGYANGEAMASIFTSCLQVLSLAVTVSTEGAALVYFWLGIAVIVISMVSMVLVVKYNRFYDYHMAQYEVAEIETMLSVNEIIHLSKKLLPNVAAMGFILLTVVATQPNISSLVVSENVGGGEWNDKYFVPVIAFLLPAVGNYIGRVFAQKVKINISGIWFTAFTALRTVMFVPLVMLCNAQPREYLPVVFPHDYQFIVIMGFLSITGGWVLNTMDLIVPKLVLPEEIDSAYYVHFVETGVLPAMLSCLNFISVEVL